MPDFQRLTKLIVKHALAPRTIFLPASKDQDGGSIKDGAGRRRGFRLIFAG